MAESADIPGWTGSDPNANDWNRVRLGQSILPPVGGYAEIEGLEIAIEVDTKKAKGSEKPRSKDNGVKPAEFDIVLYMTQKDWPEYLKTLPDWNPRRPGRNRAPQKIIHPLVNGHGIQDVRVISLKTSQPSSKNGLKVTIHVAEWFDKPVAVKKSKDKTKVKTPQDNEFKGWADSGPLPELDPAPDPTDAIPNAVNNHSNTNHHTSNAPSNSFDAFDNLFK